ncbi:hypothetical protein V2J09_008131 [Rumex salicifolius]
MLNTRLFSGSTHLTTKHPVDVQSLQWRRNFSNLSFTHSLNLKPIKPSLRCTAKPPVEPKSGSDNPNRIFEGVDAILNTLIEEPEKIVYHFVDSLLTSDPDSHWPGFEGLVDELSSCCSKVRSDPNLINKLSVDELLGLLGSLTVLGTIADLMSKPIMWNTQIRRRVGLLGAAKPLKRELNWIAESADTSTREGLSCRGKIHAWVNVNNIRRQRSFGLRPGSLLNNEYIVIPILVAAQGDHMLPTMQGNKDLKDALRMLGSIPTIQIRAVEFLGIRYLYSSIG